MTAALAGCAGGAPEGDVAGTERQETRTTPGTRTSEPPSPKERPPTPNEIRWAGRLIEWIVAVEAAAEEVAAVPDELAKGGTAADRAVETVRRRLPEVEGCRAGHDEIGPAPTLRLGKVGERMLDACAHFADGSISFGAMVNSFGDPEVSDEQLDTWAAEWKEEWTRAFELARNASQELVSYSPANRRRPPKRAAAEPPTRVDPTYSQVAGELAGTHVEVVCWSEGDWKQLLKEMAQFTRSRMTPDTLGFTGFGDDGIHLAQIVCDGLATLAYGHARPEWGPAAAKAALGVGTLAHEAKHVEGTINEPAATCYGMQLIPETARLLGADADYARLLATIYWEEIYPRLPTPYRSEECRDGGGMDARPKTAVWP